MKEKFFVIAIFAALSMQIFAQEQQENPLEIGGNVISDQRFLLDNSNLWAWNENRLTLNFDKNVGSKVKFHSQIWFRNFGVPQYNSLSALYNKSIVNPFDLEIREANVKISGFLTKNLDMTFGRQRIAWGTADKINTTDNLNPYDLEDLLDFGRHRSSDAVNAEYYFNNRFSAQVVFMPFFQPTNLPVGIFADVFSQAPDLQQGMTIASMSDSLCLPEYNLAENMTAAAKIKGFVAGFDFSLSYIYGRDFLPQLQVIDITPVDTLGNIDLNTTLYFPRQHILGFDLAGNIAGIGVWGELATFIPDSNITLTTNFHTVNPVTFEPMTITSDSILIAKDEPYFKYVVGADYTFSNGIYMNFQYNHGFFFERGKQNLNDYYFVHLDKTFFYDKLKVMPLSGALIINDYNNLSDNYALIFMPQITYKPVDNAEITLSTAIIDGKGSNMFSSIKDFDMFIFKFKYEF